MDFCFRCVECCKNETVLISSTEMNILEKELGKPLHGDLFIKDGDTFFFWDLKKTNGCPFLSKGDNGFFCSIYNKRPKMCRMYHCGRTRIGDPIINTINGIIDLMKKNEEYRKYKIDIENDGISWGISNGWRK